MATDILQPPVAAATLVELLRWRAEHQPHQLAYIFLEDGETDEHPMTYEQLDRCARTIAAGLQQQTSSGDRVLLLFSPGLDFLCAFFGCLYSNTIAVPLYPPHPSRIARTFPRIRAVINDSQPALALTTAPIQADIEAGFVQVPDVQPIPCLPVETLPASLAMEWREPSITGDTLAFLQYTSGSTASPKGVMVSHTNLLYNQRMIQAVLQHPPDAPYVSWLPLFHDMGLIGNALNTVYLGVPCILMSPMAFLQRPIRWLQAITRYKAHTSGGPNFAYDLCVRKISPEQRQTLDLSSWRVAFNGSEPVRHETLLRFTETFRPCGFRPEAMWPCYGLAEATLLVSGGLKTDPPISKTFQAAALEQHRAVPISPDTPGGRTLVGCGKTWLDGQIVIADPETCCECPPGHIGEIWAAGPHIAHGYWGQHEATEQTFRAYLVDGRGPFMRTGDLGFLVDDELFVASRLKDLIIIDGRNHYPQDIEQTVEQSHTAVRPGCTAAFSIDVNTQEQLVIVAELERHYRPDRNRGGAANGAYTDEQNIDTIAKTIRQAVSAHHDLSVYRVVFLKIGGVPKTSSGKIQRHACRAGFLAGTLDVLEG